MNGVEPMNDLDRACLMHDMETEPRGPYRSRGNPIKVRAADLKLEQEAGAIARVSTGKLRIEALIVVAAMQANRLRASRGGPLPLIE